MKFATFLMMTILTFKAIAQTNQAKSYEAEKKQTHEAVLAATSTATLLSARSTGQQMSRFIKAHDALPKHVKKYANTHELWSPSAPHPIKQGDEVTVYYEIERNGSIEYKTKMFVNNTDPRIIESHVFAEIFEEGGKIKRFSVLSYDALKKIKVHTFWAFADLALTAGAFGATLYELGEYGISKKIVKNSASRLNSDRSISSVIDKNSEVKPKVGSGNGSSKK